MTGCTDDTAGYQFANDPRPTRQAATPDVVVTQPPPPPAEQAAAPRPFAELVVARGAPDRIYFGAGAELWTVAASGSEPGRVFAPDSGESIVGVSPSPSGDQVAVLVASADGGSSVLVIAPDGALIEVFDRIPPPPAAVVAPAASPAATPVPDATEFAAATPVLAASPVIEPAQPTMSAGATPLAGTSAPRSIDWSPQGDQLLVGFEPGGLVALSLGGAGEVRPVLPVTEARSPWGAAWSPTGEQVAFVADGERGDRQVLYLAGAEPMDGGPRALVAVPSERAIFAFSWLPDGRSLLFTEGDPSPARTTNADLWQIDLDGEGRRLVASAGSAAPVADIDLFAPSPDGRAVAYTVVVPGDLDAAFHSLWVRDLAAGRAYLVQVSPGGDVSDLWWTSAGLVYRTDGDLDQGAPATDSFELYRVGPDGASVPILRATVGAATPAATPVSE
ncbi:MAG: PD40 domain-containing protein [Chloroflexia bacterium]|nr:PD40 domain-containing protein [Chloroflexia bacterium]